jgi:hypothetical protein
VEKRSRIVSAAFVLAALLLLLMTATCVSATESTRADYVASAEPICKKGVKANANLFVGVQSQIEAGALKKAGRIFLQATKRARQTHQELGLIPRPAADKKRLTKWLSALGVEVNLLGKIGSTLRTGKKALALHYIKRLHRNAIYANNLVLGFGFAYCTLDLSKFS